MEKYDGYALVTGGARGMGAAICRQLAADGYDVVCNYVSPSSLAKVEALAAEVGEKYGRKVIPAQGDVSKYEECEKVVHAAVETLGEKLAILVNNAGITHPGGAGRPVCGGDYPRFKHKSHGRNLYVPVGAPLYVQAEYRKHRQYYLHRWHDWLSTPDRLLCG